MVHIKKNKILKKRKGIQLFLGITFSLVRSWVFGGRRVLVFTAWPGLMHCCLWSRGAHMKVPGLPLTRDAVGSHRVPIPSGEERLGEKLHPDSSQRQVLPCEWGRSAQSLCIFSVFGN